MEPGAEALGEVGGVEETRVSATLRDVFRNAFARHLRCHKDFKGQNACEFGGQPCSSRSYRRRWRGRWRRRGREGEGEERKHASERRRYGPFRLRHLELKLHPPGNEISWSLLQRFIHAMIGSEEHVRTLVLSTGFEGFGLRQYALFFARNVEELVFSSEGILMDRSWYLERTIDWKTKKVLGTVKKNVKVTPNPNSQSAWYDRKSHTMTALEPEVGNGWIDYVTIVEERDEETGAVRPVKRALKRELVWDLSQITCFWRSESDMKSVRDYLTEPSSLRSLTLKNIKIGADFRLPPLPCLEILVLEATQWVGRGWVPVLRNAQKSLRTFKAVDFVVDDVDKRRIGEVDDFRNWVDNVYDIPYDVEEEEKIRIFREERKSFPFWNKNMVFTPKPLFMEKLETFICQGLSTPIWTSLHHWLDTDDDDEFDHDDDEEDDDVLLEDFGMDDASGTELEEGDPENILGEEVLDERDQEFLDLLESMGGSPKSKNRALVKRRERRLAKLIMMMRKKRLPTPELLMPRLKLLDLSTLDIFAGFGKWCGRGFVHFASGIGFAQWKSGVYDEKPDCAVYQAWLMEMLDRECEEGAQLARLASWSNGGVPVEEDDIQDPTSGVGYAIALGRNLSCNGMGVDHLLPVLARDDEDLDEDGRWKRFRLNSSGLDDSALHSFLEAGMGLGMGLGCVGKSKSEGKDWKIALELSSTQATDRVIVCLPNICPSLRELDVRGADSVTCRGVARMVEKFRELSEGARRIERVFVNEPLKASFGAKIDWAVGGNWPKRLLKMTEPVDFSIPSAPGSGSSAPKLPKPTDVLPKDPEEAKLEEMRLGNGVHKSPWEYADSHQWEYRAYDWLHWVEVIPFSPKIDLRTFGDEERICMGLPPLETTKWAAATLLASLPTRRTSRAEELGKLPESHMTIGIRSQGGIGWGLGLGMNLRPMPWKW
ncbi:hypothetical protein BT69DRAFT_140198 [Atractiella rhizophila]|nr:hypothetical protein BT69DRAFT_140198 [Atractiella rhizophila]